MDDGDEIKVMTSVGIKILIFLLRKLSSFGMGVRFANEVIFDGVPPCHPKGEKKKIYNIYMRIYSLGQDFAHMQNVTLQLLGEHICDLKVE